MHTAGTLPHDNVIQAIQSVSELPIDGIDAAGGAGHKAIIEVEYANSDVSLHTTLFVKMPWQMSVNESAPPMRAARLAAST
eukprot:3256436-Prymnesium_polylepis.1